ncbi:MAG: hypothetical protein ABIQ16_13330 [Polyangiaceae bacterium]
MSAYWGARVISGAGSRALWSRKIAAAGRSVQARFCRPNVLVLIALAWFAAAFYAIVWTWGIDPLVFPTPDEAAVRYAADLIGKHHAPCLALPMADPEDLLHPRSWLTLGDKAWPTYAPVGFYVYGWLLRAGFVGRVVLIAMPASGVAAFSAGVGLLLPQDRRWLALLTPALAFPMLFWILRTWVNISPLLIGCSWCLLCWAKWQETDRSSWLAAALFFLGFGAAVRPDYAAYLFVVVSLFSLAARPARWRLIIAVVGASGVLAVSANMALNKVITGHALQAAYQVAVDRQWGPEPEHGIPGLGILRSLVVPMGLPTLAVLGTAFRKYWVDMGPIALLLFGQAAIVPLVLRGPRLSRILKVLGVLAILLFMVSRLHEGLYGAATQSGEVQHSVPRYLTPLYLIAVVPPVLFVARARSRLLFIPGTLLLAALALSGAYEISVHGFGSQRWLKGYVHGKLGELEALSRVIPTDAIVYSAAEDKWLWSRWRVASIDNENASAVSIARAVDAQLAVYVIAPSRRLNVALSRQHISLARVDGRHRVYQAARH